MDTVYNCLRESGCASPSLELSLKLSYPPTPLSSLLNSFQLYFSLGPLSALSLSCLLAPSQLSLSSLSVLSKLPLSPFSVLFQLSLSLSLSLSQPTQSSCLSPLSLFFKTWPYSWLYKGKQSPILNFLAPTGFLTSELLDDVIRRILNGHNVNLWAKMRVLERC